MAPQLSHRASTATTCCRWRGSRRTSASTSPSARWRICRRICGWSSSATAAIGRSIEQAAEETRRRAIASRSPGAVNDDELVALYRDALCLVYVPFDEDYGLATLEAFLAGKPVITARDSGGTLEFVRDGDNGFVVDPEPDADRGGGRHARRAIARRAASLGAAGRDLAAAISWDTVIERLLSHG